MTPYFDCSIGTRQGCVSSPKLFSIFINDLANYVNSPNERGIYVSDEISDLNILMFADDVASFADTVVQLQRQIIKVEKFSKGVGLEINLDKTKLMVFRNGGVVKQSEKWSYDGNLIEVVPFYKYLGVYFSSRLSWSKTHLMLSLQARKAMNYILRLRKHFGTLQINDMFRIFYATVKPILCYGSQMWGYQYVEKWKKSKFSFVKDCVISLKIRVTF